LAIWRICFFREVKLGCDYLFCSFPLYRFSLQRAPEE
jgi:hypothetical protein